MRTTIQTRFYGIGAFDFKLIAMILKASANGEAVTVRKLMRQSKVRYPNGIWLQLERLRKKGLVDWEPRKNGTIHLTCRFIPANKLGEAS